MHSYPDQTGRIGIHYTPLSQYDSYGMHLVVAIRGGWSMRLPIGARRHRALPTRCIHRGRDKRLQIHVHS